MNLKEWVDHWNNEISLYTKNTNHMCGTGPIVNAYEAPKLEHELDHSLLPEPYIGDPLRESLKCVFLTLNPGLPTKQYDCNDNYQILQLVKEDSYSGVFKEINTLNQLTQNFWKQYCSVPSLIINEEVQLGEIVGIDLIPWHSTKFGKLRVCDEVKNYINDFIFEPLTELIAKSELKVAFAVGSQWQSILKSFDNFDGGEIINQDKNLKGWPKNKSGKNQGKLTKRNFQLWKQHNTSTNILVSWHQGGNKAPNEEFKVVIQGILANL